MVTLPKILPALDIRRYVADDIIPGAQTLSSSIASILIERSPMHAQHARTQGSEFSRQANFGSAVHALVFGGQGIEPIDAAGYTTKAAREARDYALDRGAIPLLASEFEAAQAVRDVANVTLHSLCTERLLHEHTFVWAEGEAFLRSRPDAISQDGRIIVDLKVTGTNARTANNQFFSQGYDMQAMFMERAADALHPDTVGKRSIYYMFVEADPPHGVAVLEVSEGTRVIARKRFNAAVNLWTHCIKRNEWPGYQGASTLTTRPTWHETSWLVREETDEMINVENPT